jgi:hypothetical protein
MIADKVMIDMPAATWEKFVQTTTRQQQPAHDVLLWLIQNYVQRNEQMEAEFYSELTRRYLQGTLRRTGSIIRPCAWIPFARRPSGCRNMVMRSNDTEYTFSRRSWL